METQKPRDESHNSGELFNVHCLHWLSTVPYYWEYFFSKSVINYEIRRHESSIPSSYENVSIQDRIGVHVADNNMKDVWIFRSL